MIEMLTVVGIIAVLVAVSIPVVNSSLEKAQKATDAANERAAKGAMLMESFLTEGTGGTPTELYYDNAAGQWKTKEEVDASSIAAYGKCEKHKGCYLKGTMNGSDAVLVWENTDGTPVTTLCSETLMAESGGGSTPPESKTEVYGNITVTGSKFRFGASNEILGNINASKVLIIEDGAEVTISGSGKETGMSIVVKKDATADITLKNVDIEGDATDNGKSFMIEEESEGNVTIRLKETNTLKGGGQGAGLEKNGNGAKIGKLTITGDGTLNAIGGYGGAGIGGGNGKAGSNIYILSGTVTATGDSGGAGIGGGDGGAGNNIEIKGGKVTATGNGGGKAIGGGSNGGTHSGIKVNGNPYDPNTEGEDHTFTITLDPVTS